MPETIARTRCKNCGFETPVGSGKWDRVELPKLGALTQCPECESTNTTILD